MDGGKVAIEDKIRTKGKDWILGSKHISEYDIIEDKIAATSANRRRKSNLPRLSLGTNRRSAISQQPSSFGGTPLVRQNLNSWT